MFTRMTTITNIMDAHGKTYTNANIVIKVLRSLPKTWEAKDLTKLPFKEIIGSLITHEITMDEWERELNPKKILAFKTVHNVVVVVDDDDDKEID
jgi:hypothetical protein